jgi:hypothetical protein
MMEVVAERQDCKGSTTGERAIILQRHQMASDPHMSRTTLFTAIALLSAGALYACTSLRPHVRTAATSRGGLLEPHHPGDAPAGRDIGGAGRPVGEPGAVAGGAVQGVRRVCRTGSRPSGWIAVAYVSARDGDCPVRAKGDSSATAAILTYYADRPRDAILDVCADEPVPSGWIIDDTVADASDSCPGVERNGSSTSRIRRVR